MERRRRKKRWKAIGIMFLSITLLAAVGVFVVTQVFTVEKTEVTGNEHYSSKAIADVLLDDEYSWNSLYVYFKYKFVEPKEMPFVDTMEVSLESPHTIRIDVHEKMVLGRVYVDTLGQNAYFDKDGFVVEMSSEVIDDVPEIDGLDIDQIVLYEKLPIKKTSVLKDLLAMTQILKKYGVQPECINYEGEGSFKLEYGEVAVMMGQAQKLNEKVTRLSHIMPKLEGQRGTLHLESWAETTTDITFEKIG